MRLICVAMVFAALAGAEDRQLQALHATLVALRARPVEAANFYGGAPELTTAKHQLRDWIETRLNEHKTFPKPKALQNELNAALKGVSVQISEDEQNRLGTLGKVKVREESDVLILTTAIGVICSLDVSAYAYQREGGGWRRVFELETNDYGKDKYWPQARRAVHVWRESSERLRSETLFMLVLGNGAGCTSIWHEVTYSIWLVGPSNQRRLVDKTEMAIMRGPEPVLGTISGDWRTERPSVDVLIEFTQGSIDVGVHNREAVRHFLIDGDQVRRVAPVALSPRDFVDEWITTKWTESAAWSANPNLEEWHRKLRADEALREFGWPTKHCQTPDLWQVSIERPGKKPLPTAYFLVRWRPPYQFTLIDVAYKPWPRCTERDKNADEWRTLFATQEWR